MKNIGLEGALVPQFMRHPDFEIRPFLKQALLELPLQHFDRKIFKLHLSPLVSLSEFGAQPELAGVDSSTHGYPLDDPVSTIVKFLSLLIN
jgi:hypothetical protein